MALFREMGVMDGLGGAGLGEKYWLPRHLV